MPLVVEGLAETAVTERQARARKIKKQFTEGPLVRVATARHQAEAELISGLLLEHGVPSLVRRTGGFDVPDMMFSGPREVLVPESGAETAREALGVPDAEPVPVRTVAPPFRLLVDVRQRSRAPASPAR